MSLQRKALMAQDAPAGNPNHSKENGQFTSGGSSKGTESKPALVKSELKNRPGQFVVSSTGAGGRAIHHIPVSSEEADKMIAERGKEFGANATNMHPNDFANKTAALQREQSKHEKTMQRMQPNEATKADTAAKEALNKKVMEEAGRAVALQRGKEFGAKDVQPAMALDPADTSSSDPASSPIPWKGRNLNDDPVGDRSMPAPNCDGGAGWPGLVV